MFLENIKTLNTLPKRQIIIIKKKQEERASPSDKTTLKGICTLKTVYIYLFNLSVIKNRLKRFSFITSYLRICKENKVTSEKWERKKNIYLYICSITVVKWRFVAYNWDNNIYWQRKK